ncbi:MAG: RNA polymerase sigma-70 factor [Mangrovibacterium sp.]
MKYTDETYCLERIAIGDHAAFDAAFMQYFPKVKYFIANLIKSESIAEELSQDIFLKIWTSREHLPNLRSFNSYVFRMAKNSALNYLEHKYVEESYVANYNSQTANNATPEEELNAKELELLIQLTVDRMPEQRRKIYTMSRVELLEVDKIAELLGITPKTVHNQLSLALRDIRTMLSLILAFYL